jgi:hypothetical protein
MNCTFSPVGVSTNSTSDHAKIPVVSLSQPPLQEKPVNGLSSGPNQSVDP